jgi:hypothetical protein
MTEAGPGLEFRRPNVCRQPQSVVRRRQPTRAADPLHRRAPVQSRRRRLADDPVLQPIDGIGRWIVRQGDGGAHVRGIGRYRSHGHVRGGLWQHVPVLRIGTGQIVGMRRPRAGLHGQDEARDRGGVDSATFEAGIDGGGQHEARLGGMGDEAEEDSGPAPIGGGSCGPQNGGIVRLLGKEVIFMRYGRYVSYTQYDKWIMM